MRFDCSLWIQRQLVWSARKEGVEREHNLMFHKKIIFFVYNYLYIFKTIRCIKINKKINTFWIKKYYTKQPNNTILNEGI